MEGGREVVFEGFVVCRLGHKCKHMILLAFNFVATSHLPKWTHMHLQVGAFPFFFIN